LSVSCSYWISMRNASCMISQPSSRPGKFFITHNIEEFFADLLMILRFLFRSNPESSTSSAA
jgi:hypothetical protein